MAIVNTGGQQLQIKAPVGSSNPAAFTPTPQPAPVAPPAPTGPSAGQPAPPPPATGPDSITTGQAANTDFTTDPGYKSAVANSTLGDANAASARAAQIKALVIKYGGLPAGFKDAYGDVDQATLDAARGNQYSTLATLAKQYNDSVRQLQGQLAARGMLNSGEGPYAQYQAQYGYGQNQYDAANQFSGDTTGALNAYTNTVTSDAQGLNTAIGQAEQNMASNPADQSTEQQIPRNDQYSSLYGQPMYGDPATGLYTQDGKKWVMPTPQVNTSGGYVPNGFQGFDNNGNWIGF